MTEVEAGKPDAGRKAILDEFAALRVSPGALEESLGISLAGAAAEDFALMRSVLLHMRRDKLTLGKAIAAARRPPAAKAPAKASAAAKAAGTRPERPAAKKEPPRRLSGKDNLLIVESPHKAKTIKKFLGADYTVKASMGHVRDMPVKVSGSDIGIDFQNRYQPAYVPIASREKVIKELRAAVGKAGHVYLAPDPDREGEAIAWHLKELLNLPDDQVSRVTFNAITRSAVREGMARPSALNMDLVNAQQGRRVLDRIVGYRLSPFLWKKVSKGLSAGRVQSVAVRLVAEREQEIQAFAPVEFWRVRAVLSPDKSPAEEFQAELVGWRGGEFVVPGGGKQAPRAPTAPNEAAAAAIVAALRDVPWRVAELGERDVKSRPAPPFITSTLQQAAANLLYMGAQRTMRVAQRLYEGVDLEGGESTGLITYMRTDSTRVAPEAIAEARDFIGRNFAPPYLPDKPNFYAGRKGAQDAHEAVRPTAVGQTPDRVKPFLAPEQHRLYELIWRRFVASQLAPAEYRVTTAKIEAGDGLFEARGRRVLFDGHTLVSPSFARKRKAANDGAGGENADAPKDDGDGGDPREDEQVLPALAKGDGLKAREIVPSRHHTQPPPRFGEASLVRELEKEGIGRPSTYAPIVQTIQERGYVRQENRRFFATRLGLAVTGILKDNFPDIMDVEFTAQMEKDLDGVEEGKVDWSNLVDRFYRPFEKRLNEAMASSQPLKGAPAPNGEPCPECGAGMTIRYSQRGAFLGCSKYPECSGSRELPDEGGGGPDAAELAGVACPVCGGRMLAKRSRFGVFLACAAYPACKGTRPVAKDGKVVRLPEIKRDCEKCGRPMQVKSGRRGPFLACTGYPECRNTKHLDKNGQVVDLPEVAGGVCEKCGSPMVVRMSRRGPFLSCSAYPKCRNAKPLPKAAAG
ncbi:MAG: type I DNA topoisomerase [Planctomycetota bacterium]|nr:type I DNA topoisomerase [Planctomycetota bacterium]